MRNFILRHILCAFTDQGLKTVYVDPDIPTNILQLAEPYCRPSGQACLLPEPIPPALGCVFLPGEHFLLFRIMPSPRGRHARGALLFGHGLVGDREALEQLGHDPVQLLWDDKLFFTDDSEYLSGETPAFKIVDLTRLDTFDPIDDFKYLIQSNFAHETAENLIAALLDRTRTAVISDIADTTALLTIYRLLPPSWRNGLGIATSLLMQGHRDIALVASPNWELTELFATVDGTRVSAMPQNVRQQVEHWAKLARHIVAWALDEPEAYRLFCGYLRTEFTPSSIESLITEISLPAQLKRVSDSAAELARLLDVAQSSASDFVRQHCLKAGEDFFQHHSTIVQDDPAGGVTLMTLYTRLALASSCDGDYLWDSVAAKIEAFLPFAQGESQTEALLSCALELSPQLYPEAMRQDWLLSIFVDKTRFTRQCMDATDLILSAQVGILPPCTKANWLRLKQTFQLWIDAGGMPRATFELWQKALAVTPYGDILLELVWSACQPTKYHEWRDNAVTQFIKLLEPDATPKQRVSRQTAEAFYSYLRKLGQTIPIERLYPYLVLNLSSAKKLQRAGDLLQDSIDPRDLLPVMAVNLPEGFSAWLLSILYSCPRSKDMAIAIATLLDTHPPRKLGLENADIGEALCFYCKPHLEATAHYLALTAKLKPHLANKILVAVLKDTHTDQNVETNVKTCQQCLQALSKRDPVKMRDVLKEILRSEIPSKLLIRAAILVARENPSGMGWLDWNINSGNEIKILLAYLTAMAPEDACDLLALAYRSNSHTNNKREFAEQLIKSHLDNSGYSYILEKYMQIVKEQEGNAWTRNLIKSLKASIDLKYTKNQTSVDYKDWQKVFTKLLSNECLEIDFSWQPISKTCTLPIGSDCSDAEASPIQKPANALTSARKTVDITGQLYAQQSTIKQKFKYLQQYLHQGKPMVIDKGLPDALFYLASECQEPFYGDFGSEWWQKCSRPTLVALGLEVFISYAKHGHEMTFPYSSSPTGRHEGDFLLAQDRLRSAIKEQGIEPRYDIKQLINWLHIAKGSSVIRTLLWGTLCRLTELDKQHWDETALNQILNQLLPITKQADQALYKLNVNYASQFFLKMGGEKIKKGIYGLPLFALKQADSWPTSEPLFVERLLSEYIEAASGAKLKSSQDPMLTPFRRYIIGILADRSAKCKELGATLINYLPNSPKYPVKP
jgi:hypothetical protein